MFSKPKGLLTLSFALLFASATFAQEANPAVPGTINYVEGSAAIAGQPLTQRAVGSAQLDPGQVLTTGNGRVEILLTPGIFFRLDENSAVRMVAPGLTHTELELVHGQAEVEADNLLRQNNVEVAENGTTTQLLKNGLYAFNAAPGNLRVFDGKAAVFDASGKPEVVKGDHMLALTGEAEKSVKFDPASSEDDFYNWSSLRSQYLTQANSQLATEYAGSAYAPGWMWDPWLLSYTWLPGDGMFLNPFGWGFYSPWWIYAYGPVRGGYYGYGYHGVYRGPAHGFHGAPGAFHGGAAGGFHGGSAGGFHGGGMGGGRR
ncbi:FecR family protein [Acidipila sp. 4G-K13]|uniref:FecR protein domain-containing protein n=1 Tax=Paracidobacterium acidisoli TaxID=2303751 RepID=A0A372IQS3_9BACT|nr:FecR family protein [Paracidobacterium acidisoli]